MQKVYYRLVQSYSEWNEESIPFKKERIAEIALNK